MIRNFFTILLRNLYKKRVFSAINILGLAIGIASFILIMLYVLDEMGYDRYHKNADRIHRVCMIYDFGGVGENSASLPFPVANAMQQEFPHMIEKVTRVFNFQTKRSLVEHGDIMFNEHGFFFADSTFFQIFDHEFISGNPANALDEPMSVVITESIAAKYFAGKNPVGETIEYEGKIPLKVTGVIRDVPSQSHFRFGFVASLSSVRKMYRGALPQTWVWNPCWTYVLLKPGVGADQLESLFPGFVKKYYYDAEKERITMYTQPLTSIHLNSRLDYEIESNSNRAYVIILSIIAGFILVIARINFMNLATATSANRRREIGIRKTTGAYRNQLIFQFLAEALFMALISMLLAILFIELVMPWFNDFTGKSLYLGLLFRPEMMAALAGLWLFVGILSGTYPAFFLSGFKTISILKGTHHREISSGLARKILVVFQFTVSISLAVGTLYIFHQLNYLRSAKLGFNKEDIILLPVNRTAVASLYESFKKEVVAHSNIQSVTAVDDIVGAAHNTHEFRYEGIPEDEWHFFPALVVKHDFVNTFGIEMVAGRDYDESYSTDPYEGILINESMVKHLGWKSNEAALGKKFRSLNGNEKVIGVFKDFQATSLHESTGPFVLNMKENPWEVNYFLNYVAIRVKNGDIKETLSFLEKKWNEFEKLRPFEYSMLSDELAGLYKDEKNLGMMSLVLTLLILLIAALGLFGLALFMAEKRTREISIRKVLGANIAHIFMLLSKEFVILILISMAIAWPVSYLVVDTFFLAQFVVHLSFQPWILLTAGMAALLIAMMITSYRAYVAWKTNPAETLKIE
jgi:putative ABC transport system permease protein